MAQLECWMLLNSLRVIWSFSSLLSCVRTDSKGDYSNEGNKDGRSQWSLAASSPLRVGGAGHERVCDQKLALHKGAHRRLNWLKSKTLNLTRTKEPDLKYIHISQTPITSHSSYSISHLLSSSNKSHHKSIFHTPSMCFLLEL